LPKFNPFLPNWLLFQKVPGKKAGCDPSQPANILLYSDRATLSAAAKQRDPATNRHFTRPSYAEYKKEPFLFRYFLFYTKKGNNAIFLKKISSL